MEILRNPLGILGNPFEILGQPIELELWRLLLLSLSYACFTLTLTLTLAVIDCLAPCPDGYDEQTTWSMNDSFWLSTVVAA